MSTPDQPMTRRQLRELAATGALPVQGAAADEPSDPAEPLDEALRDEVSDEATPEEHAVVDEAFVEDASVEETPVEEESVEDVPVEDAPVEEIPAEDVSVEDASVEESPVEETRVEETPVEDTPAGDSSSATDVDLEGIDLNATPLTRRQARQLERIRTASVPLITAEEADAYAAARAEEADADVIEAEVMDTADVERLRENASADDVVAPEELVEVAPETDAVDEEASQDAAVDDIAPAQATDEVDSSTATTAPAAEEEIPESVTVGPQFGAALLAGEPEVEAIELPPSFDELIARNASSGSTATPSALILSQAPEAPSLSGPITATGEIILTGSYRLPEGLGSAGADPRSTDDKQTDAVLIDGELPASSSPTPIAASAAVSTIRGAEEVIRPPAPEKGNRLVLTLAITAGVLMIAVIGVLVAVVASGALS